MKISLRVTSALLFVTAATVAFVAVNDSSRLSVPFYLFSSTDASFLEDFEKNGQAKMPFESILSFSRRSHWSASASLPLQEWISDRADPALWSEAEIKDIAQFIVVMSVSHNIQPSMVLGLIEVESNFQADAVSNRGAIGLMQVMPATAEGLAQRWGLKWNGPKTLEDPKRNIEFAMHYIGELRKQFKRSDLILTAYNIGPAALEKKLRGGEDIPLGFYNKVAQNMRAFRRKKNAPVAMAGGNRRWL